MDSEYIIRPMMQNEIDFAIELATTEGWNPGLHDRDCFYAADRNGFFIGLLNGQPIACLSAVKYSDSFGFMGLYIVKEPYRGQQYGLRLWHAGLNYLKGCNIGLDGVVAQQDNYIKSGFQAAYRNIRYQGLTGGQFPCNPELIELANIPFAQICLYDSAFFPADRTKFLKLWLTQPDSIALGIIRNNRIVAYGVIRPCRIGYKIAPLFADNPLLAETLWLGLLAAVEENQSVFLDICENNPHARALVKRHDLQIVFETSRMYTKYMPTLDFERMYGITSFELG
ncbi:GNAT family N-acetyltransferase [Nitrosomonas ureae]|nr:GNAT family N-acetyltransferase [Nitrosomonas ureae]